MKQKLLFLAFSLLISYSLCAQVTAGQIDDFQSDTTTAGWFEGGASPNPPVYVASGGPLGAGDAYISDDSAGGGGPGSRQVVRNVTQWAGNYTGEGIIAIRFQARAITSDLNLRIGMDGDGGRIVSSSSFLVTAGSGWQNVEISISAGNMQTVGGFDVNQTLSACAEMRILSAVNPAFQGDPIMGTMDLDNIEAATTLGVDDFTVSNVFKISPNPSTSNLNIGLAQFSENTKVEVYDILGKRILFQDLKAVNTSIDASSWSNGVYLVKISNDLATQTKRFIKQ